MSGDDEKDMETSMARLKGWSRTLLTLVVVYGLAWLFVGDHGHTYYLEPAK
jgi:hypothetical protein